MEELRLPGVGALIRQLREEAGFSQIEFAKKLGWNRSNLSRYESDTVGISLENLDAIADAIGIQQEELTLRCLQMRYAGLAKSDSPVGKLMGQLLAKLEDLRT